MGLMDRIKAEIQNRRAFVLGPAVVQRSDVWFGKEGEEFQPASYGEYIATSNTVFACIRLRAEQLASLPLRLMRQTAEGPVEITKGQAFELFHKVNPFWTFNRLIEMSEKSLCLWGENFWFFERGEKGNQIPREIWWGRPDRVKVIPDHQEYLKGFIYRPVNASQDLRFDPGEVGWFRYTNPLDEYEGLSPIAAARLSADLESASMKSNRNLFTQGMQVGGIITPPPGTSVFTEEQGKLVERMLDQRFKGVDKAHRWAVLNLPLELKSMAVSPKDAEFVKQLNLTVEFVARAFGVPIDLIGGQRTYENVQAAMRILWVHTIVPEARFIASEINEQIVPMFDGEFDFAEFDFSGIDVLQEGETEAWGRAFQQIDIGAMTVNEWRQSKGMEPLPWGDQWWAPFSKAPVGKSQAAPPEEEESETESVPTGIVGARAIEFGSAEHERLWNRFVRRLEGHQGIFARFAKDLLRQVKDATKNRLKKQGTKAAAENPFNKAQWIKTFRIKARPMINEIVKDAGVSALEDLGLLAHGKSRQIEIAFDLNAPEVIRFIEKRAQRFAREVPDTVWQILKESLSEGIDEGESIPQLLERVETEMGQYVASSAETIARTETIGAANGGTLLAWEQSKIVQGKEWLAALDERTRETHVEAHGQRVGIDDDFIVGAGRGPAPGQTGIAEEDINCRCTMVPILDIERL